jgi:ribosomal protein S11
MEKLVQVMKNKQRGGQGIRRERKFRLRLLFRKKFIFLNTLFQTVPNSSSGAPFTTKLNFRITQNNIFCTLENIANGKILEVGSAGKYKVKVSKKTLRYNTKLIIGTFLRKVKTHLQKKLILINLIGPARMRKSILKQIFEQFGTKTSITVDIKSKKCFNGCRPKKKRRKKQKGLRIFK